MTDSKSVTRFLQTKMIPPSFWNACDYVLHVNFVIAHILGKMNTAADLSRQKTGDNQNLNIDPVIDRSTSRDVGHTTVTEQNVDPIFKSQLKDNQVQADTTEIFPNTANTKDTPPTSEVNDMQDDYNSRGGKQ